MSNATLIPLAAPCRLLLLMPAIWSWEDRNPTGFNFVAQSPTTGDIAVNFKPTGKVTFSPNTAADFDAVSSRSAEVRYETETNDVSYHLSKPRLEIMVKVHDWWTYAYLQQGDLAINTAQIIIQGNRPFIVTPPPDPSTGVSEQMLFTSLFLKNLDDINEAWSKTKQTPIPFHFVTSAVDFMFNSAATVFTYSRK